MDLWICGFDSFIVKKLQTRFGVEVFEFFEFFGPAPMRQFSSTMLMVNTKPNKRMMPTVGLLDL